MIHARSVIGTPTPPPTRYRLQRVGVLLAHHVGVGVGTRYRSADPARVLSDARATAAYGISTARAWEYNYMIGLDGGVFTQAGEFMAAHCRGFNTNSAAVLFLNANDVQVNAAQIDAWHDVRAHMVAEGITAANHTVGPHYRYRSTGCPGIRAEAPGAAWPSPTGEGRLGNLIPALAITPTPTPPPTDEDDDDMADIKYIATPPKNRPGNPPWLVVSDGATSYAANESVRQAQAKGWQLVEQNDEQYDNLLKSAGLA